MPFLRLPPQIVRLVMLTIAIVGSYMVARYFLTPPSFGEHGWYRSAAPMEIASLQPVFAGRKSCEECHSDIVKKVASFEHKGLSCEGCHAIDGDNPGVARAHAANPDVPVPPRKEVKDKKEMSGPCIRCHEANPSRPKWLKQVITKAHYPGQNCTGCHFPHQPNEVPE